MNTKNLIARSRNYWLNFPGKSIDKKIIVFESDDWGSLRIRSNQTYNTLIASGIELAKNPYNKFDSLETETDFLCLFDVLRKFVDYKGSHPKFTANFIMGNPDFDKIEDSSFTEYYFETFLESYKSNPKSKNNWNILEDGIKEKLFKPQFHAREHLNVQTWMKLLQQKEPRVLAAFKEKVFSLDIKCGVRDNLMAAYDFSSEEEKDFIDKSIIEGLDIFKSIFKENSASMIAPCNVWGEHVEKVASNMNVRYLQSLRGRNIPQINHNEYLRSFPSMGSGNDFGQRYFVRNAYFEPSTKSNYDWVESALNKIEASFTMKKPAIISTHRLNYIGSLNEENREVNLKMLENLLSKILVRWNDVEFMSTDELGKYYDKNI